MPLTAKQQAFVEVYTDFSNKDTFGNATESATKAGYQANSRKAFETIGLENLGKLGIVTEINAITAKRKAVGIANRQKRQEFWTEVMETQGVSMGDRLRASELLGKSEADFTENINQAGSKQPSEMTEAERRAFREFAIKSTEVG